MATLFTEDRDPLLDLADLTRYPVDDLEHGRGASFLRQCQEQMRTEGWCNFDGFIRRDALDALASEANALLPCAEALTVWRTIYQGEVDPSLPDDDPRRREYIHRALQLANDQIPADSMIQQLYRSDLLTNFVRRVQGKARLYRYADDFQALNIVALPPGGWHAWHYDLNECTVTLLLQSAEQGGDFTFLPNSRTDGGEDRDRVDRLLSGDRSQARSFARGDGTLTLFRGGYSLHGVTEVGGRRPRVSAVLTYDERPGSKASEEVNIRIYGPRVAKILAERRSD